MKTVKKCSSTTKGSCGMKGGLFNPIFQGGYDLTGQNGGLIRSDSNTIPNGSVLYDDGSALKYDDNSNVLYI